MMANTAKRRRALILPVIRLEKGKAIELRIEDKMRLSDVPNKDGKEPAHVCTVTDLQTGEQGILICSAMIKSTLEREFPSGSYVGHTFEIKKGDERKGGKGRYNTYAMFVLD